MNYFSNNKKTVLHKGFNTLNIVQEWNIDQYGKYKKYSGKVDINNINKFIKMLTSRFTGLVPLAGELNVISKGE